jgi:hypothetical protein
VLSSGSSGWISSWLGAALACAGLSACAVPATPPVVTAVVTVPPRPAGEDPVSPEDRLLALLTADNPGIERVATSLAGLGDEPILREAGRRLVTLARAAAPPPPDASAEDEEPRPEALRPLLAAMSHVGGPEVIAYAFGLAEDERAPIEHRSLALRLLRLVVPDTDRPAQERRLGLEARLAPSLYVRRASDRAEAVRSLARAARACARRDPAPEGTARVTLRFTRKGGTTSHVEGSVAQEVQTCLAVAANRLRVAPLTDAEGEVIVPFTFLR